MVKFYPYIAGNFVEGEESLCIRNPFTDEMVGETSYISDVQYEMAVERALKIRQVALEWPIFKRYESLMYIASSMENQLEEFTELICQEAGKPYRHSHTEVLRAIQTFKIAAEESKRLPAEYLSIDWTEAGQGKEAWVKYFPIGLVAGISPFNFPLNLAVHKIAPAIAAGCPIILKPSSQTPLSTLALAKIIDESEVPKGMVSILPMQRHKGERLVSDSRINLLSFTGSAEVGWSLKSRAGNKRVILELGGNAGMIVTPSADIELAVKKAVSSGFAYSGQICIHTQRIFVHSTILNEFIEKLLPQVTALKFGNPLDPSTDISVMIDADNAIRVENWVNEALSNGAHLLCGGHRRNNYYEPTILTHTHSQMKVWAKEIFGPVVILEPYTTLDEAINMVNCSDYGLQAAVFTSNLHELDYSFQHLEVGGVIINDAPTFRVDHMPYGGVKLSGLGREGVKYAIRDMLEPRILVKNYY